MPGSALARAELHPALPRALPFALLIVGIALDGWLKSQAALPWDLRWDYAARSLAAVMALIWGWRRLDEVQARPRWTMSDLGWALGVGLAVWLLWIAPPLRAFAQSIGGFSTAYLLADLPLPAGTGFIPLDGAGQIDWPFALPRLLGSALLVPIAEELFWRSLLMRWIDQPDFTRQDPRQTSPKALLLQALLFGAEHDLWLAGVLAGIAYGWLYRRTGRLWPGILAHGLTNGALGLWVLQTRDWSYW